MQRSPAVGPTLQVTASRHGAGRRCCCKRMTSRTGGRGARHSLVMNELRLRDDVRAVAGSAVDVTVTWPVVVIDRQAVWRHQTCVDTLTQGGADQEMIAARDTHSRHRRHKSCNRVFTRDRSLASCTIIAVPVTRWPDDLMTQWLSDTSTQFQLHCNS